MVATGYGQYELNRDAFPWLAIIGGVIFSTLQMQDMADMEGDSARGRRTLPLVHGENTARWLIAIPVAAWSLVCPPFWACGVVGYSVSVVTGIAIVLRVLLLKDREACQKTWALWCLWTVILYLQPLLKDDTFLHGYIT